MNDGMIKLMGAVVLMVAGILLSIPILEKVGVISVENLEDKTTYNDFETRDCKVLVKENCGLRAAWDEAESDFKKISFCTSYERCVVGCAMLIVIQDAGLKGDLTTGIHSVNRELGPIYNVDVNPKELDFNSLTEGEFSKIAKIVDLVRRETMKIDIVEGLSGE